MNSAYKPRLSIYTITFVHFNIKRQLSQLYPLTIHHLTPSTQCRARRGLTAASGHSFTRKSSGTVPVLLPLEPAKLNPGSNSSFRSNSSTEPGSSNHTSSMYSTDGLDTATEGDATARGRGRSRLPVEAKTKHGAKGKKKRRSQRNKGRSRRKQQVS